MPVIVDADGITFSGRFDFELFLRLEGASQAMAAIEAELASAGAIGRSGPDAAQAAHLPGCGRSSRQVTCSPRSPISSTGSSRWPPLSTSSAAAAAVAPVA